MYKLFLDALLDEPEKIAVVNSQGESFTNSMVAHHVNQWAHYFLQQDVKEKDQVAILLDNEDHHFFISLALDRINATCVSFDMDAPRSQLTSDFEELELKKIFIQGDGLSDVPLDLTKTVILSDEVLLTIERGVKGEPPCEYHPAEDDILCIFGSSGTTGKRKWIPIPRGCIFYWYRALKYLFKDYPIDGGIPCLRSPAYDARLFEYLWALSSKVELHLLTRRQRKDFGSILARCEGSQISSLLLIASQLTAFQAENVISRLKQYGVKHIMVTGDACTPYVKALCEKYEINLWNAYGPTELGFGMSILRVNGLDLEEAAGQMIVPIGEPFGEVGYYLIENEICAYAPHMTPGYLNSLQNDRAFMSIDGRRVYRTGDLAEKRGNALVYLGRINNEAHCKINGVKVSPDLIEQCFKNYNKEGQSDTLQVAVVVKKDQTTDENKPYAYLVTSEGFNKKNFLTYLKSHLKKEEIPILISLPKLPILHSSDKVDKQNLIARIDFPEEFFLKSETDEVDITEDKQDCYQTIRAIWSEILHRENLPSDVDFSFLGGTSIHALEMISKIQERLDPSYSYIKLLSLGEITLESVAASIHQEKSLNQDQAIIQKLVVSPERKRNFFLLPALLGEGYFSYRYLAEEVAKHTTKNVYGLSDPGILEESLLPTSMEQAVNRYISSIKSIQATGPYHLMGFSFGSTLAYEVAKKLEEQKEEVKTLHLLDGFPPYLYKKLSNYAYADLLKSLVDFMISTLNNRFYQENLAPIEPSDINELDKIEQVERCFSQLIENVVNSSSKRLLNVAKQHLIFLLTAETPSQLLRVIPIFYLTNTTQPYLQVIEQFPGLSRCSSEYHYFFWTHYFHKIIKCGKELKGDHLSIVRGASSSEETPQIYWDLKDFFHTPNLLDCRLLGIGSSPGIGYRLAQISPDYHQLILFFYKPERPKSYFMLVDLKKMGLLLKTMNYDENSSKFTRQDRMYSSGACAFCYIPNDKLRWVQRFIAKENFQRIESKVELPILITLDEYAQRQEGNIDLIILWKRERLTIFSFSYIGNSAEMMDFLNRALHLLPSEISEDKRNIVYEYATSLSSDLEKYIAVDLAHASTWLQSDMIRQAMPFVADFLSLLEPYLQLSKLSNRDFPNYTSAAFPIRQEVRTQFVVTQSTQGLELYGFLSGSVSKVLVDDVPDSYIQELEKGNFFEEEHQEQACFQESEALLKINPLDIEALIGRAYLLYSYGFYYQSIKDLSLALKQDPHHVKALMEMAVLHRVLNVPHVAWGLYKLALINDQNSSVEDFEIIQAIQKKINALEIQNPYILIKNTSPQDLFKRAMKYAERIDEIEEKVKQKQEDFKNARISR